MADLTYITNVSLDGYIEDAQGDFQWTEPDDELFGFLTDLIRPVGTFVYGRRLYEAMAVWESDATLAARSPLTAEFARVWQGSDKVVHSTTLSEVWTARSRLERRFDPDAVRDLKASADRELSVGGAGLAALAFDADLVDECHLLVHPVVVGDGKPAFGGDARVRLELRDERRFPNGVVYLHYDVQR